MKINTVITGLLLISLMFTGSGVALAIEDGAIPSGSGFVPPPQESIPEELQGDDFRTKVLDIVNFFLTFLGFIAILAIIYFGFRLIVSGGDEEAYNLAKKGVLYVALGILLILLSYAIVQTLIVAGKQPDL